MSREKRKLIRLDKGDAAAIFCPSGKVRLELPEAKDVRCGHPSFWAMFCVYAINDKQTCDRTLLHVAHLWGYRVKLMEMDTATGEMIREHESLPMP